MYLHRDPYWPHRDLHRAHRGFEEFAPPAPSAPAPSPRCGSHFPRFQARLSRPPWNSTMTGCFSFTYKRESVLSQLEAITAFRLGWLIDCVFSPIPLTKRVRHLRLKHPRPSLLWPVHLVLTSSWAHGHAIRLRLLQGLTFHPRLLHVVHLVPRRTYSTISITRHRHMLPRSTSTLVFHAVNPFCRRPFPSPASGLDLCARVTRPQQHDMCQKSRSRQVGKYGSFTTCTSKLQYSFPLMARPAPISYRPLLETKTKETTPKNNRFF